MKKLFTTFVTFVIIICSASANPVNVKTAQEVAQNFFATVSDINNANINLTYTETDSVNEPLYYVFNINSADGFVIISANDIFHPVIGYSTEKRAYTVPVKGTNIYFWMQRRKTEMISDLAANLKATPEITNEWNTYSENAPHHNENRIMSGGLFPSSTAYLVKSLWDQSAPYNDDCPGTSPNQAVTGCVATAMCQIMRYWQYPATGMGSSGYGGSGYGFLSANYTHPYAWSTMPVYNPNSTDTNLARAMSDAGISVDMYYSPSGSGAEVITSDDPYACAQIAYTQYFKYSDAIMDGLYAFNDITAWQDTLKHELDRNRPIQYVGADANAGGHTWVCDGYDTGNNFHMNWGWSGMDDGWYSLDNLNPAGFDFIQNQEALIGIMPPAVTAAPQAYFTASAKTNCLGNEVQYIDTSSNQPTSWNWSFPGGTPSTSTLQNPVVTYSATGMYSVQLTATNSYGSNTITGANYIKVDSAPSMPVVQNTGSLVSCVPATYSQYQWYRNNALMPGNTAPQFWASQVGLYKVFVTAADGCSVMSGTHGVSVLGVNEVLQTDNVKVYPNPANSEVNVSFNIAGSGNYVLSVSNLLGKVIYKNTVHLGGATVKTINMANWSNGVYILSIEGNNTRIVKRILVN